MKITKILYSKKLNQKEFDAPQIQAKLLGQLKPNMWNKFGPISGIGIKSKDLLTESELPFKLVKNE